MVTRPTGLSRSRTTHTVAPSRWKYSSVDSTSSSGRTAPSGRTRLVHAGPAGVEPDQVLRQQVADRQPGLGRHHRPPREVLLADLPPHLVQAGGGRQPADPGPGDHDVADRLLAEGRHVVQDQPGADVADGGLDRLPAGPGVGEHEPGEGHGGLGLLEDRGRRPDLLQLLPLAQVAGPHEGLQPGVEVPRRGDDRRPVRGLRQGQHQVRRPAHAGALQDGLPRRVAEDGRLPLPPQLGHRVQVHVDHDRGQPRVPQQPVDRPPHRAEADDDRQAAAPGGVPRHLFRDLGVDAADVALGPGVEQGPEPGATPEPPLDRGPGSGTAAGSR